MGDYYMKGLIKLIVLLAVIFVISSLFKGGDYIRRISGTTGINLHSLAATADSLRIGKFIEEKKLERGDKEKAMTK